MNDKIYVKLGDIPAYLGINPRTVADRVRDNSIPTTAHPLDKRVKLALKSDLDALKLNVLEFGTGGGK